VNNELFYPRTDTKDSNINRFLHVSSFNNKHKNVVDMLRAFKEMQDDKQPFILHLITEGDVESVWRIIDKIGIDTSNCIVQEKASPSEVAQAMREADCFVLFSNYETFSVVLAEAWMTGIPAIYSKCGGLTEIADTNRGVQVEKGNLKSLTNALMNFNLTQFNKQKIVEESKAFTVARVAKKFLSIYEKY
jgi:glycosyltransferase involved in cell wall biosynthesis